jgi:hypothetical protein
LVSGNNTIQFLPVNAPMDYPPVVANIDLLVNTGGTSNPDLNHQRPIFDTHVVLDERNIVHRIGLHSERHVRIRYGLSDLEHHLQHHLHRRRGFCKRECYGYDIVF